MFTGKMPPATYKNLEQHFPMFVDDIFKILFNKQEKPPSVRTALEKSAEGAKGHITGAKGLLMAASSEIFIRNIESD